MRPTPQFFLFRLALPMLLLVLAGCTTGDTFNHSTSKPSDLGGINIGNPQQQQNELVMPQSVVPDFDSLIATDLKTLIESLKKVVEKPQFKDRQHTEGTLDLFKLIILASRAFALTTGMDEQLLTPINQAKITGVSSTPQFIEVAELFDENTWEIEIVQDVTSPEFIRFYGKNKNTNLYQFSYLLKSDGETPVRGIFVYVNPELFEITGETGFPFRFFAFSFDIADPTKALFTVRNEKFKADLINKFASTSTHYQCNLEQKTCIAEVVAAKQHAGETIITDFGARLSWDILSENLCAAAIDYFGSTPKVAAAPIGFSDLKEYSGCTIDTPVWGKHLYTAKDLPSKTTAEKYFVDGQVKTGWDTLSDNLIELWLTAQKFE